MNRLLTILASVIVAGLLGCSTVSAVHDFAETGKKSLTVITCALTNDIDRIVDARLTLYEGEIKSNKLWIGILTTVGPAVASICWYVERKLTNKGLHDRNPMQRSSQSH